MAQQFNTIPYEELRLYYHPILGLQIYLEETKELEVTFKVIDKLSSRLREINDHMKEILIAEPINHFDSLQDAIDDFKRLKILGKSGTPEPFHLRDHQKVLLSHLQQKPKKTVLNFQIQAANALLNLPVSMSLSGREKLGNLIQALQKSKELSIWYTGDIQSRRWHGSNSNLHNISREQFLRAYNNYPNINPNL